MSFFSHLNVAAVEGAVKELLDSAIAIAEAKYPEAAVFKDQIAALKADLIAALTPSAAVNAPAPVVPAAPVSPA